MYSHALSQISNSSSYVFGQSTHEDGLQWKTLKSRRVKEGKMFPEKKCHTILVFPKTEPWKIKILERHKNSVRDKTKTAQKQRIGDRDTSDEFYTSFSLRILRDKAAYLRDRNYKISPSELSLRRRNFSNSSLNIDARTIESLLRLQKACFIAIIWQL